MEDTHMPHPVTNIAHCTFHACPVHFIAFAAYVVAVICCTYCTIFYNKYNRLQ